MKETIKAMKEDKFVWVGLQTNFILLFQFGYLNGGFLAALC